MKRLLEKIKYYKFVIGWLYRNRTWDDTRQKYKALNRAWIKQGGN